MSSVCILSIGVLTIYSNVFQLYEISKFPGSGGNLSVKINNLVLKQIVVSGVSQEIYGKQYILIIMVIDIKRK